MIGNNTNVTLESVVNEYKDALTALNKEIYTMVLTVLCNIKSDFDYSKSENQFGEIKVKRDLNETFHFTYTTPRYGIETLALTEDGEILYDRTAERFDCKLIETKMSIATDLVRAYCKSIEKVLEDSEDESNNN